MGPKTHFKHIIFSYIFFGSPIKCLPSTGLKLMPDIPFPMAAHGVILDSQLNFGGVMLDTFFLS